MSATAVCEYCGRKIELVDGVWVDPAATDDDAIWRETCGENDTFEARHEPERFCACGHTFGSHTKVAGADVCEGCFENDPDDPMEPYHEFEEVE